MQTVAKGASLITTMHRLGQRLGAKLNVFLLSVPPGGPENDRPVPGDVGEDFRFAREKVHQPPGSAAR